MRLQNDSVWNALTLIGDRWTFLVLREAFFGVRRFDQIQRNLGIARNILTDRLRQLEASEIVERRLYQSNPERFEYRLTEKGLDLYPVLLALMRWGDKWTVGEKGVPLLLYHKPCGSQITPSVICTHCGLEIKAREVYYEDGPGAISS
jgi:DNA-binding HxlR family transcriptional regulator